MNLHQQIHARASILRNSFSRRTRITSAASSFVSRKSIFFPSAGMVSVCLQMRKKKQKKFSLSAAIW